MRWLSTFTLYAGCLVFLASPAAAQPITGHTNDVVFGSSTTATVSEGSVGREESSIGVVAGSPLYTEGFQFQSGVAHPFTLAYEPGVTGGIVIFGLGTSDNVNMASTAPFDSILIRTRALHADMSIEVERVTLGPPPSKGGGGPLLYETAAPLTLASSRAFGADGIDILKISGDPRLSSLTTDGFTLQGEVTATFSAADPPPALDDLLVQLYTSLSSADPDDPDDDGDGVPNSEDNCPNKANPPDEFTGLQPNNDDDSLGDACDNCPNDTNEPDEFGIQANEDGDIFGDACDNCPLGCRPNEAGTCKIDDDTNTDGDEWGDRCDNCPGIANDDQADFNGNGIGNLCDSNTIAWNNLFSVELPLAAASGEPLDAPALPGVTTTVELFIDCSTDVIAANIGINLTNTDTTFLDFSNCTEPGGPNLTERHCGNAKLTELGDTISQGSSVIGPGISSAGDPPIAGSPPPDMVILQLQGRAFVDGGRADGLICAAQTEDIKLGVIRLDDFTVGSNPLSSTGFNTFVPELTQLVGPLGPVPNEQVVFQVNPPGTPLVAIQLRPADLNPDTHYELFIKVDLSEVPPQEVARIAFGLTSSVPAGLADMNFGGCQDGPIGNTPAVLGSSVRGCVGNDPTQLSSRVDDATEFEGDGTAIVATYTVGPDSQAALTALGSSRLPDTLYVALDSGFVEEGDAILNSAGGDQWLGQVVFAADADPPQITFQGIFEVPGYESSPVVSATAVPIPVENVALGTSFSTSSDSDGDSVPDDLENCVRVENPDQDNTGGVGFVTSAENFDNIGDACQCADPGRDGVGDNGSAADAPEEFDFQDDVVKCQEALSGQALGEFEDSDFCKVTTSEGGFSIVDILVFEADTANPGSSGLGDPKTGSLQNCGAAEGT
jgi:hypothetical protein